MTLIRDLKKKAIEVSFVSIGISNPEMLKDLSYGMVSKITDQPAKPYA